MLVGLVPAVWEIPWIAAAQFPWRLMVLVESNQEFATMLEREFPLLADGAETDNGQKSTAGDGTAALEAIFRGAEPQPGDPARKHLNRPLLSACDFASSSRFPAGTARWPGVKRPKRPRRWCCCPAGRGLPILVRHPDSPEATLSRRGNA